MGTHDFKHNKVPLFARKPGNINNSRSAAPNLVLVPASRQCMCQVLLGLKDVRGSVGRP